MVGGLLLRPRELQRRVSYAVGAAGERLEDDKTLHEQGVPPGCKCLAAVDATLLEPGAKPDSQSAYWC